MGKPAARIGDMTMHGGSIVVGCPTVLIGGMPAARIGDMHVCPMMTPGTPPIPHVGGPVSLGSTGVLIGGMPAARMGDMCVCVGPPDSIALGCMTVLIGEAGGGGGGGGGGGAASGASAANASAAVAQLAAKETTTKREHWAEFEFVDKAGKPISGVRYKFTAPSGKESTGTLQPDGKVKRDALSSGQCKAVLMTVWNAKWSKNKAEVGEKVKLTADTDGFEDRTPAKIEIFKRDLRGPDVMIASIDVAVKNKKLEAEWEYPPPEKPKLEKGGQPPKTEYSATEYYFEAIVENCKARSDLLGLRDWVDITYKDEKGKPLANAEYKLTMPDGTIKKGKLDASGRVRLDKIQVGKVKLRVDPR